MRLRSLLTIRTAPHILDVSEKKLFSLIQVLRGGLLFFLLAILNELVPLGVALTLIFLFSAAGMYAAPQLARRGFRFLPLFALQVVAVLLAIKLFRFSEALLLSGLGSSVSDFAFDHWLSQLNFLLWFYLGSFALSWAYWRFAFWHWMEIFVITLSATIALAAHRNYQLDTPKQVSSLAWNLNISPQACLLGIGAGLSLLMIVFTVLSNRRPLFIGERIVRQSARRSKWRYALPAAITLLTVFFTAKFFHQRFEFNLSRATNGVGQGGGQGQSPLGFHSATGKTKQPAALVRLEGDYQENPWSPMLYLREGALSEFNGHELVIAPPNFDRETPVVKPGQFYTTLNTKPNSLRKEVTQSVYLLTSHTQLFALDELKALRPIKNPAPDRFESAYQAISLAPAIKLQDLSEQTVGDSHWDQDTWTHYLRAPGSRSSDLEAQIKTDLSAAQPDKFGEDLRYRLLSKELTDGFSSAVIKASAIANYLSKTSIYTRQPGHNVPDNADPVAPYLFAEKRRGYCVHFAHAAVYLMRLAGIPARIGTGYLTDLRYAKDGHILLNLGDRHAWPEVYVQDFGWVVVDVTPTQAENEPELIPDESLLEELMGKLNPVEQFLLPENQNAPEEDQKKSGLDEVFTPQVLYALLGLCGLVFLGGKLWLRFGYKLTKNQEQQLRRAYISASSQLIDLGRIRNFGETRREYASRLENKDGVSLNALTAGLEKQNTPAEPALSQFKNSLSGSRFRFWKIISALNPRSLFYFGKW